jgi:hypothetical protein
MKNKLFASAILAAAVLSSPVWADDTSSGDGSHKQMMKDCLTRQKAQNSSASPEDMKKACRSEIKMRGGKSAAEDTPNQTTPTTKGDPAPHTGSTTNPPQ